MPAVRLALATEADRECIYRMRHAVYSEELGQHPENGEGRLTDSLDGFNVYLVAKAGEEIVGFVSVTLPGQGHYSIDKYFARTDLPFAFDDDLYEIRLLTVPASRRGASAAGLLMYAAFRWIEAKGGTRIVAIGRRQLRAFYLKAGLQMLGLTAQAGAVAYELMTMTVADQRRFLSCNDRLLRKLERSVLWELDVSFAGP